MIKLGFPSVHRGVGRCCGHVFYIDFVEVREAPFPAANVSHRSTVVWRDKEIIAQTTVMVGAVHVTEHNLWAECPDCHDAVTFFPIGAS